MPTPEVVRATRGLLQDLCCNQVTTFSTCTETEAVYTITYALYPEQSHKLRELVAMQPSLLNS